MFNNAQKMHFTKGSEITALQSKRLNSIEKQAYIQINTKNKTRNLSRLQGYILCIPSFHSPPPHPPIANHFFPSKKPLRGAGGGGGEFLNPKDAFLSRLNRFYAVFNLLLFPLFYFFLHTLSFNFFLSNHPPPHHHSILQKIYPWLAIQSAFTSSRLGDTDSS